MSPENWIQGLHNIIHYNILSITPKCGHGQPDVLARSKYEATTDRMVLICPTKFSNSDMQYASATHLNKNTLLLLLCLVIRFFSLCRMQAAWWENVNNLVIARLMFFFLLDTNTSWSESSTTSFNFVKN